MQHPNYERLAQIVNYQNKSQINRQIGNFRIKSTGKPAKNARNQQHQPDSSPARHLSLPATKMKLLAQKVNILFPLLFIFFGG
jgi:hypothetical protein